MASNAHRRVDEIVVLLEPVQDEPVRTPSLLPLLEVIDLAGIGDGIG